MHVDPLSRFFLRHDLTFRTPYDHGAPLKLVSDNPNEIDIEDVFKRAIAEDRAKLVLGNKDIVRATHFAVRRDVGFAIILFRRSDPDATTPMWEDQVTRAIRDADKKKDDALTFSAHLFIELATTGGARPSHRSVLEEISGLGRSYVEALIGDVLRAHKYEYKDKRGQKKETHTVCDFEGIKSDSLDKAVGEGSEIEYLELVKPAEVKGLDTEHLVPRDVRMKLYIRTSPEQALPIINRVKKWSAKEWKDVRVRINMPERRSRMVSVARTQDAADVLFVRAIPIKVDNPLKAATDTVNEELMGKALQLLQQG